MFTEDAEILAPMLTKPVHAARRVLDIVSRATRIAGPIRYTLEVNDPEQTLLFCKGQIGGFVLEAATILVDGTDGLTRQVRVLMRPWPVATRQQAEAE